MRVRLEDPQPLKTLGPQERTRWEKIREVLVLVLWSAILTVAAFGWWMIYEGRRHEDISKLKTEVRDLSGRVVAVEGPQKDQKAVSRRQ